MIFRSISAGLALTGVVLTAGCRESARVDDEAPPAEEPQGEFRAFSGGNRLAGLPGSIYASQASSRIHWQPYTRESFDIARDSRRLVLVVIAMPQQQDSVDILKALADDHDALAAINGTYVPILVDGDSIREMGLLSAVLCSEIGSGLQLPLMVWMTPEAKPVAWMPLPQPGSGSAPEMLMQSHSMVSRTWEDDPGYVSRNSRLDQNNRAERLRKLASEDPTSEEPAADSLRALRQLVSLYDPVSRTFDEAGGLFPSGAIDLLATGAILDGIPQEMREKSRFVLGKLLEDLLISPMFDPLDGGVFSARRGTTWDFPVFHRDCSGQARVAVSILNAYEATGDRRALEKALGVIRFAESTYGTQDGLFTLEGGAVGKQLDWLWRHEDVAKLLSAEELSVWMSASGMKETGNLPSEADPLREHFRCNSLGSAKSAEEIAKERGLAPGDVLKTLESARAKLLAERTKRLAAHAAPRDGRAHAVASFRMVSAYAAFFRITGDTAFRDRAAETLRKAREHFADGPRLRSYSGHAADSLTSARAFVYGAAIQAALDVEAVTLDGASLMWAGDLASTLSEDFVSEGQIMECAPHSDLVGLPLTDSMMLFDESTLGVISMAESRLEALGIPLVPSLKSQVSVLPMSTLDAPVLHSDLIQASLMREFGVTYLLAPDAPVEIREALLRSPLKGVNRRVVRSADKGQNTPKAGEVLRLSPRAAAVSVRSAEEIKVPSLP